MAGSATRASQIVKLEQQLEMAEAERDKFHALIVEHMPDLLTKELKTSPLKKVTKKTLDQVLLMGKAGKTETQWIDFFAITPEKWGEFKAQHPELVEAVTQGLLACKAYYQDQSQLAIKTGNQKFPMTIYKQIMEGIDAELGLESGSGEKGAGNAASLVLLDLREDVAA